MIEIAIAIGVIGFALVAIIGILPQGMNAQKDNREDTIISEDAPYFLNAIRNGEMRTNGGILTNYVETIYITNTPIGGVPQTFTYSNPNLTTNVPNSVPILTNDATIIGLLSLPEYDFRPANNLGGMPAFHVGGGYTNEISAVVRAMSGSAMQQNGANSLIAFRYQMNVEIDPWNFSSGNPVYNPIYNPNMNLPFPPNPAAGAAATNYVSYMCDLLHEVRLKFSWPLIELPNGTNQIGPGRQTYRSMVSSKLTITNSAYLNVPLGYFQPLSYTTNFNSFN